MYSCIDLSTSKSSCCKKCHNLNIKIKRQLDLNFRITSCLRARFKRALKKNSRSDSILQLLGCSVEELKKHLESQFTVGMTWDNYGKWEIDHIRPCASFDFTKLEEQHKCFNYNNLQPLWSIENRRKSDKY